MRSGRGSGAIKAWVQNTPVSRPTKWLEGNVLGLNFPKRKMGGGLESCHPFSWARVLVLLPLSPNHASQARTQSLTHCFPGGHLCDSLASRARPRHWQHSLSRAASEQPPSLTPRVPGTGLRTAFHALPLPLHHGPLRKALWPPSCARGACA